MFARTDKRPNTKRGTVAIVVALTMVSMLGLMALSIDVAYMYSVEAELQGALDASALAGAAAMDQGPAAVRARVQAFAAVNNVGGKPLVVNDADIVFGDWDVDTQTFTPVTTEEDGFAIRVTTSNTIGMFFGQALGVAESTRSRSTTAAHAGGAGSSWDIVVVQDISGSFRDALDMAKSADKQLVSCVKKSTVGSKIGVVSFSTNATDVVTAAKIDDAGVETSVGSAIDGLASGGYTNIGQALENGVAMLTGTGSTLPPAIVLVSDGLPNQGQNPTTVCVETYTSDKDCRTRDGVYSCKHYAGECKNEETTWGVEPQQYGINMADAAEAAGISVYTLYYAGSSSADAVAGSAYLSSLIRGDGTAHTNVNPADMETTLKAICRSRFKLRIVE